MIVLVFYYHYTYHYIKIALIPCITTLTFYYHDTIIILRLRAQELRCLQVESVGVCGPLLRGGGGGASFRRDGEPRFRV